MRSRFIDFCEIIPLGGRPEDILPGDQSQVVQNEDDFDWLVAQAEGMYWDMFGKLPNRNDPDHFKNWEHEELFRMVFMCAKERLSENPSDYPA